MRWPTWQKAVSACCLWAVSLGLVLVLDPASLAYLLAVGAEGGAGHVVVLLTAVYLFGR